VVRLHRRGDRHDLRDLTVAIRFEGEYTESYADGDNRDVLPTDTMKNTVYAVAGRDGVGEPEAFGLVLSDHFLERNARLERVTVDMTDHFWRRIAVGAHEHGQAFVRAGPDARTARVVRARGFVAIDAGISDLLILKSVSLGAQHGYGVLLRIQQITGGALSVEQGALYPALYRLEHQGLLDTEWGTSENNRRAKFYRLTAAGRRRLREETDAWTNLVRAMEAALTARPAEA